MNRPPPWAVCAWHPDARPDHNSADTPPPCESLLSNTAVDGKHFNRRLYSACSQSSGWEDLGTDGASCDASGSNLLAGSQHQTRIDLASPNRRGAGVRSPQALFIRSGAATRRHEKLIVQPDNDKPARLDKPRDRLKSEKRIARMVQHPVTDDEIEPPLGGCRFEEVNLQKCDVFNLIALLELLRQIQRRD